MNSMREVSLWLRVLLTQGRGLSALALLNEIVGLGDNLISAFKSNSSEVLALDHGVTEMF